MADPHVPLAGNAPSTNSTQSCTIEMVPRHLRMHTVSEAELDAIAVGGSSVNLTFFGVCFGALISFAIGLYSGGIDPSQKSMYAALVFASAILSAFFGIRGGRDYFSSQSELKKLKQGRPNK